MKYKLYFYIQDCGKEQPRDYQILSSAILQQCSRRLGQPCGELTEGSFQPREGHHHTRSHQSQLCTHGSSTCALLFV